MSVSAMIYSDYWQSCREEGVCLHGMTHLWWSIPVGRCSRGLRLNRGVVLASDDDVGRARGERGGHPGE